MKNYLLAVAALCGVANAQPQGPTFSVPTPQQQTAIDAGIAQADIAANAMPPGPMRDQAILAIDVFRQANDPQPNPGEVGPPAPQLVVEVPIPGGAPTKPGMETTPESNTIGCVEWTQKVFEGGERIQISGPFLVILTPQELGSAIIHEGRRVSQSVKRTEVIEDGGPPGGVGPPSVATEWAKKLFASTLDANEPSLIGAGAAGSAAPVGSAERKGWQRAYVRAKNKKTIAKAKLDKLNC